ncbi:MAG: DNA polymerase I [Thermoanaerobaculales bacterium]|jgi:DNA polymerase-1|nr:DNA polymerase I [Thermoanaerobaculales bacterium]
MTARKKLYLIDGPNIAFRAFFAIGGMTNSAGLPTNALFGFTNMLLKLIRDERPDYLAVTWDPKGGSFRERDYPDYKGTRPDMPDALRAQMPHFSRVADAFEIPFLCIDDFEADDVMGTLARRHSDELDVVLVTSDKDLMQLVGDHVTLLDTMKDKRISYPEVEEKFGCRPELVPDALGIWGDSSDNIPGVKGIGEKGVKALLAVWNGLDDIYANLDEVTPPGAKAKLERDRDNAFLSRELATIRDDAPVAATLDELALSWPPDEDRARSLFTELEFRGLLREFGGEMTTIDRGKYRLVTDDDELAELVAALEAAPRFALDTETTSLDSMRAELVGLSFCADEEVAWYVPVAHAVLEPQLDWETVRTALLPVLTDPATGKTGQNLKYDLEILARHGVELAGIDGDTLLADYLLNPDRRSHKLDDLALVWLNHKMIPFSDVVAKGDTFDRVPLDAARDYAAEDAHVTWLLDSKLHRKLEEEGLDELYRSLELPLMPVLARMEMNGIAVDSGLLGGLSDELADGIAEAEQRCFEFAGREFNIGSVKQLREVLFDELELPVIKKTKTGPSTNEAVLTELAIQHPLPRAILDYRSLVKLKNTYVDPLPELVHPETGRIHTSYSQTTAATGRLSSTDPNLQNIPVRTPEGRRIREAFVAPEGRVLVAADYSQVELRILAHLCGGTGGFAEAFAAGADVHTETATGLFDVGPDEIDRQMRTIAKAVNFGIVYGQSAFGLAQQLRIPRGEANTYIKRFKERFPEIEDFKRRTLEGAAANGYVETLLGRRRPVPDLGSGNFNARAAAERVAINTPVQGSAADLIKKAMLAVDARLREEFPGQLMLLQVHDELLLEVDEDQAEAVGGMVSDEMIGAISLNVPLVVDLGIGRNWNEAH